MRQTRTVSKITKGHPLYHTTYYLPWNSSDWDFTLSCTFSGRITATV